MSVGTNTNFYSRTGRKYWTDLQQSIKASPGVSPTSLENLYFYFAAGQLLKTLRRNTDGITRCFTVFKICFEILQPILKRCFFCPPALAIKNLKGSA